MTAPPPTIDSLRHLAVFRGLPDASLDWLIRVGSVSHLPARKALSSLEAADGERYCFVLEGAIAIARLPGGVSAKAAFRPKGAPNPEVEYVGRLEPGACFSDGFLAAHDGSAGPRIDCVATHSTTLFQVHTGYLTALAHQHTDWWANIAQRLQGERDHFVTQRDPSRRVVQDFFLRQNLPNSSVVRATRLDACMSCNKCVAACDARHGIARIVRSGASLGRLMFPVSCHSCEDKPCLPACRQNALGLDQTSGEVRVLENCTGCSACAKACPHGAIFMVDLEKPGKKSVITWRIPADVTELPTAPAKRPPRMAVKCDGCADYPDRACITACPTGALIEVAPAQLFLEEDHAPAVPSRSFSEAPFVSGLPPQRGLTLGWRRFGAGVLLLALVGLGVEVYLRATQPEISLSGQFVRWAGVDWVVSYRSGRGLGHCLGYTGASAMLVAVLYSLRTRVKLFSRAGRQSGWLFAHIWLGLIGGVLATYHSALKLDRWAGIACVLIWIIVLTGVVGRYLYGRLHAGLGLSEFELASLRNQLARWVPPEHRTPALSTLIADLPPPAPRVPLLFTMIWHEVRDRWLLLTLRLGGASRFVGPDERRVFLQSVGRWATNRRHVRYYLGAEALLRHWNIVHIVLTIIMFVLAGIHIAYGWIYKAV